MRLIFLSQYFPPENGAAQARVSELAAAWALDGDDVTILTGLPNYPSGIVPDTYRRQAIINERFDGCKVVRVWLYATPNEGFLRRTLSHLSFMLTSVLFGMKSTDQADVVIVSSPPFFSIFAAWVIARYKRAIFVIDVRDLWPAILLDLGVLRNRKVLWFLEALELWLYRQARLVVVVTESFAADLINRGVSATKVKIVPNGVNPDNFRPGLDPAPGRAQLGILKSDILVLYIGTVGLSHGLETLVDAGMMLHEGLGNTRIRIAIVGDGARRDELAQRIGDLEIGNVSLYPAVPRASVPDLLAAADLCIVTLRDVSIFAKFIPSKIFEYFAAGKAVIGSVDGEAAEILRRAGAIVVPPGDARALAEAISELSANELERKRMGEEARDFVLQHFDRKQLATKYRSHLIHGMARS